MAAAPFRDRVVHHAIVRVIEPIFEKRFIEDSFACRRGKGTHAAMRRAAEFARRWPYALKCDVRKYFPSIDHEVLVGLLRRVIADQRLMALIPAILETHADGVRQEWPAGGDPAGRADCKTRPADRQPHEPILRQRLPEPAGPLRQARVAGDRLRARTWTISSCSATIAGRCTAGREVRGKLAELRLEMHPDKYRLVPTACGVDFAGYVVRADGRIRIRRPACGVSTCDTSECSGTCDCRRTRAARVTQSVGAWVAHASHAQSYGLRRSVLAGRKEAGGRDQPSVRRGVCVAAIGTTTPTTWPRPTATITIRRTRTTISVSELQAPEGVSHERS